MADKTYTGKLPPEDGGGDYNVTLPEGSAPMDVYNAAKAQKVDLSAPFKGGPEGMVAAEQNEKHNTIGGQLGDIASSGLIGTIAGAGAPELTIGAGRGIAMIPNPIAKGVGATMIAGGIAMKEQRLALAAKGLVDGVVSETAGQIADKAGASPTVGAVTRIGVGLGSSAIISGLGHLITGPAAAMWNFASKILGTNSAENALLATAKQNLKGLGKGVPLQEVNEILAKGSQAEIAAAEKKAVQIKAEANANAARLLATNKPAALKLIDEGDRQAAALQKAAKERADVLTIASNGKTATAARVGALSDKARETLVGPQRELSPIGEDIRKGIEETHGALYTARKEQDAVLRSVRDKVVAQKVAAGEEISAMPDLAAIRKELASDARLTPGGTSYDPLTMKATPGRAKVTDPGTVRAYRQLYESLTPKNGGVLDMQAIDTVRRRLADVGTPGAHGAEGYDALQKHFATSMSRRLAKLQEDYVGEAQTALQKTYHEGSEEIRGVSGSLSKRATAVGKINPEEFAMDAKDIPKKYFYSEQKVKDLFQLIGAEKTQQLGEQYLSRTLAGHDSTYVANYLKSAQNTDWVKAVPGLEKKGQEYLAGLRRIEATTKKLEDHAVRLAKGGTDTKKAAEKTAAAVQESFVKQAKVIQDLQNKRVRSLASPAAGSIAAPAGTALQRFLRQSSGNLGSTTDDSNDN